jgi:uncharacterized protein DUF4287/uncharacterized protein DUF5655
MATSPEGMLHAVSESLASRTGRSLAEWLAVVDTSGIDPLDQKAVRRWLKSEHGVAQNSQWAIADAAARSAGWVPPSTDDYINSQYSGARAGLRPVFDALAAVIGDLGDDVRVEGRGSCTPFVRGRQFAAIAANCHPQPGGSRPALHGPAAQRAPAALERARPGQPQGDPEQRQRGG